MYRHTPAYEHTLIRLLTRAHTLVFVCPCVCVLLPFIFVGFLFFFLFVSLRHITNRKWGKTKWAFTHKQKNKDSQRRNENDVTKITDNDMQHSSQEADSERSTGGRITRLQTWPVF